MVHMWSVRIKASPGLSPSFRMVMQARQGGSESLPAYSSPRKPSAGGTALVASTAFTRQCYHCEENCPANLMCQWSKAHWCCHVCKTSYNRQAERMKNNAPLNKWWMDHTKEQRKDWFKRNKVTYEPNKRKAFDNPGHYEDSSRETFAHEDDTRWHYITAEDFCIRQKLLGRCGNGTAEEQQLAAMDLYQQAVLDKHVRKRKFGDQWLVGIFRGFEERTGVRKARTSEFKRHKVINDSVDQDAAQEVRDENSIASKAWLDEHAAASSNQVLTGNVAIDIPDGLARNPKAVIVHDEDYVGDIQREVLTGMQRQSSIAVEEDFDDFQATQAARLARDTSHASAGRPKKTVSELLADVARMKRDRITHLLDQKIKLERQCVAAMAEAQAQFGNNEFTGDLKAVADGMGEDIKSMGEKVTRSVEVLEKLDIQSLVREQSSDVESLRKVFIEETKSVLKDDVPSAVKSIQAFRKAAKTAKTAAAKKNDLAAVDAEKRPPLVQQMGEMVQRAAGDGQGVVTKPFNDIFADGQVAFASVPDELTKDVSGLKSIVAHIKWLQQQMAKSTKHEMTTAMAPFKPAVCKHVTNALKLHAPTCLSIPAMPKEQESLKSEIFYPQAWAQTESHFYIGATPFGVTEVRWLIKGSYLIAGVQLAAVTGDNLAQKIDTLLTPHGAQEFLGKAAQPDKGFWYQHDEPNSVLVVPAGYVLFIAGHFEDKTKEGGSAGLRWGFLAHQCKQSLELAVTMVTELKAAYPQLDLTETSEYNVWQECLTKCLLPAAASQEAAATQICWAC